MKHAGNLPPVFAVATNNTNTKMLRQKWRSIFFACVKSGSYFFLDPKLFTKDLRNAVEVGRIFLVRSSDRKGDRNVKVSSSNHTRSRSKRH